MASLVVRPRLAVHVQAAVAPEQVGLIASIITMAVRPAARRPLILWAGAGTMYVIMARPPLLARVIVVVVAAVIHRKPAAMVIAVRVRHKPAVRGIVVVAGQLPGAGAGTTGGIMEEP